MTSIRLAPRSVVKTPSQKLGAKAPSVRAQMKEIRSYLATARKAKNADQLPDQFNLAELTKSVLGSAKNTRGDRSEALLALAEVNAKTAQLTGFNAPVARLDRGTAQVVRGLKSWSDLDAAVLAEDKMFTHLETSAKNLSWQQLGVVAAAYQPVVEMLRGQ